MMLLERAYVMLSCSIMHSPDVTIQLLSLNIQRSSGGKFSSQNDSLRNVAKVLSCMPKCVSDSDFRTIEEAVCLIYGAEGKDVYRANFELFKNIMRKLPPSFEGLQLKVLRAAYVADWLWGGC